MHMYCSIRKPISGLLVSILNLQISGQGTMDSGDGVRQLNHLSGEASWPKTTALP